MCNECNVLPPQTSGSRVNIFSLQAFSRQSEDLITDLNLTAAVAKNLILPHIKLHTAFNNDDFLLVCDILGISHAQCVSGVRVPEMRLVTGHYRLMMRPPVTVKLTQSPSRSSER